MATDQEPGQGGARAAAADLFDGKDQEERWRLFRQQMTAFQKIYAALVDSSLLLCAELEVLFPGAVKFIGLDLLKANRNDGDSDAFVAARRTEIAAGLVPGTLSKAEVSNGHEDD